MARLALAARLVWDVSTLPLSLAAAIVEAAYDRVINKVILPAVDLWDDADYAAAQTLIGDAQKESRAPADQHDHPATPPDSAAH